MSALSVPRSENLYGGVMLVGCYIIGSFFGVAEMQPALRLNNCVDFLSKGGAFETHGVQSTVDGVLGAMHGKTRNIPRVWDISDSTFGYSASPPPTPALLPYVAPSARYHMGNPH
ncbi:hypothetical protein K505DRAFT_105207 [Melanomma pulvis-pyrius CBS 109.77]|uniref:Uncharacterized protein n=1 Tax=Melanomma pulvis-pyrius CBS 109.77 TaxID=1314802 RepID=A0A6A6XSD7_9PLEO|nr:hypothetical protein K505DRAFT_105207 [Melanomma pulvis-pyrius CBS 109.77]